MQCADGDSTVFPSQDVRLKQGTLKAEATPACGRLKTEKLHFVVAGVKASPVAPYPLQMVMINEAKLAVRVSSIGPPCFWR